VLEAQERYDPLVERELSSLGLTSMWANTSQQRAKELLGRNDLNIHTIVKMAIRYSDADPQEVFYLDLILDFWPGGYFEFDPGRYYRRLRIPPPELEQTPGLRSWLRTRWMELYPKQPVPSCLKGSVRMVEGDSVAIPENGSAPSDRWMKNHPSKNKKNHERSNQPSPRARSLTHLKPSALSFIESHGATASKEVWKSFVQSLKSKHEKTNPNAPFQEGLDYPKHSTFRNWWSNSGRP
jgi:hypothetical protein